MKIREQIRYIVPPLAQCTVDLQVTKQINNMENVAAILSFLAVKTEKGLRKINTMLDRVGSTTFPLQFRESLNLLRQDAEENLLNIRHLQSILGDVWRQAGG
eukprot:GFUD01120847.1.p1 GENE.GFUD01120847.1~~GFUD01120847.1.p1  ORF type:complete len:102 (+),score=28.24 GFUD01120847.1:90-395(+)